MDVATLCSDLVKIRSENPPGDTRDIIQYIREFTGSLDLRTSVIRRGGGRHNLVSQKPKGKILLCGHVDVVPALPEGWSEDPFRGVITEGRVMGRGATDMKGGCAAILWACKTFIDSGKEFPADLAFVCDEETSGTYGIQTVLAQKRLIPCDCIIAEPTPPHNPNIGQKGLVRLCSIFRGEPGHGSLYPVHGVSAVMEAYSLLEFMKELHSREYNPSDPVIGRIISESSEILGELFSEGDIGLVLTRIMFNPGKIDGGEKANIVAQHCTLEIDLRIPWGCDIRRLIEEIRAHAPRADITVTNQSEPSITPPDSSLVTCLLREIEKVHGIPARPIVQWAASDARYLRGQGFSVVEYGPGEIRLLHAIDEYVTIVSLENAVQVYLGVLGRYGD